MTRRLTILFITLALLVPGALWAQGNGNGNANAFSRENLPPRGYLKLTEAQKEAVGGLIEDLTAAVQPIREEEKAAREALRDAIDSDSPDATAIGELVLDVHALGGEARDEIRAFDEAFTDVLDAEQAAKYENFKELRRLAARGGPGNKAMRPRRR